MSDIDNFPGENELHRAAFEYYFKLGAKRTYQAVAVKFGRSLRTIKSWAKKLQWQDRVRRRDAELHARVIGTMGMTHEDVQEVVTKITYAALMKMGQGIANGTVVPRPTDLDRLLELMRG